MQKLIYGLGVLLALIILGGFLLPRTHRIEAHIEIDAHAATVFALVNDFERFADWVPWVSSDPDAQITYSGAARGAGAKMTWNGRVIGTGTQQIDESRPYEYVGMTMSPGEPSEASVWFRLSPGVGTTLVAWGFEVDHGYNILGRYFAAILGNIFARDYALGLERLKVLAESLPGADFADLDIEHLETTAIDIAYLTTTSAPNPAAVADALGKAYFSILNFMDQRELVSAGAPLSILRNYSGAARVYDAAIPIRNTVQDLAEDSGVKLGKTYAGPVIRVQHVGSYNALNTTHRKIAAYLAATGITQNGAAWESYVSDPGDVAESELLTLVYYPVSEDD